MLEHRLEPFASIGPLGGCALYRHIRCFVLFEIFFVFLRPSAQRFDNEKILMSSSSFLVFSQLGFKTTRASLPRQSPRSEGKSTFSLKPCSYTVISESCSTNNFS